MNVTIFSAYALWTPHFETDLEIAHKHLDAGDSVTFLVCNKDMKVCDANMEHTRSACMKCVGRRKFGIGLFPGNITLEAFHRFLPADIANPNWLKTSFSNVEELKEYRVGNFDIGYGVLASLVSHLREPSPALSRHKEAIENLIHASWQVFASIKNYLATHTVDRVYIFNGRFAPMRAAVRACQEEGVECFTHDRGCDLKHYSLFRNGLPHELKFWGPKIIESWERASGNPVREKVGRGWFEERARGIAGNWFSFLGKQKDGLLPACWDPEKLNIVLFSSSEEECVAIGDEWKNELYPSQLYGIRAIIDDLRLDPGTIHLYLRIHPNTNEKTKANREMLSLAAPFLTVLAADDPASTYELIRKANKVITFGSTVGIEAVFWGTPSILLGPSVYRNLGATYNATSHEEVINLMKQELKPKNIEPALMHGHYLATYGEPFKYFGAVDVCRGEFKGTEIRHGLVMFEVLEKIMRFKKRLKRIPSKVKRMVGYRQCDV